MSTLDNPKKLGKFQNHLFQEERCPSPCLSRLILSPVLWGPPPPSSSDTYSLNYIYSAVLPNLTSPFPGEALFSIKPYASPN